MILFLSRFAWSIVQTPLERKYRTNPLIIKITDNADKAGLNHWYPSSPQYKVSEIAAAEETLASPNSTNTIEGRQHIDASTAEPEINFHIDLDSSSSDSGSSREDSFSSASDISSSSLV